MNKQIRALKVRVVGPDGGQVGVMGLNEALFAAREQGLDLVEIAPNASPPVCKIIDYGKFRYDQSKREKESKKAQHVIKVKEVKIKPNIDEHDYQVKLKAAKHFLEKGYKVKITCMFRGREVAHPEVGRRVVNRLCDEVAELGGPETPVKLFGRNLTTVLAPGTRKK